MRSKFDEELTLLNRELIDMGARCEEAIAVAVTALVNGDLKLAGQVKEIGGQVDQCERQIESLCLKLLLRQQPVARDLRQISAALKMVTDMERIGDQAVEIASIILELNGASSENCGQIHEMAQAAIKMVTDSVDAYVRQDVELAKQVIQDDDIVDRYFAEVKTALIARIVQHPDEGELELGLLMIAKYFERIGELATNIAGWVEFAVTGRHSGGESDDLVY